METVLTMLENNRRRAPGYWIQLFLSIGIATLGLVLNSTAVVIGGMLVSPLMGPIVELAMGFAVGSSFLVLRASLRVSLSAVLSVAGAAVMVELLPFHDLTAEVLARSAPTALDLLVAAFCALAAVLTTVRPSADTTSAAAGTAIGIALVPPLCVVGFGLGTGSMQIAGGASLLFTANLSAILVLGVVAFLVLGYNQVNADLVEESFASPERTRTGRLASRAEVALRGAFGSKIGMTMRILVPVIFLGSVYLPLRKALDEVTWVVRTRDKIMPIVSNEAPHAVRTQLSVEHHSVAVQLMIVGTVEHAAMVRRSLERRILKETGVKPLVSVTPLSGARAAAEVSSAPIPPAQDLSHAYDQVELALKAHWPAETAGPLLGLDLAILSRDSLVVTLRHLGNSVGRSGEAILAGYLTDELNATVTVLDSPLVHSTVTRALGHEADWLVRAAPILDWVAHTKNAVACIHAPAKPGRRTTARQRAALATLSRSAAKTAGRLILEDSAGWSIRAADGSCSAADSSAAAATG